MSLTGLIFAKAAGAKTIITSSSDDKLAQIKAKYGVDHTINYRTHPDWATEVHRITGGEGVDHVLEVGGIGTIEQSLGSIAWGGTVSVIGFLSPLENGNASPNVIFLTLAKGATLRGILAGSKQQLEEAVKFIGSQNLAIPVDKTFAFTNEGVVSAFEYVASGKHVGKVCITLE